MVKLISLKCPKCNANLSIEENRKRCFCSYCGTQIIIDDGSVEHTYRKIDEARIKEAEANERIQLKMLDVEEKKQQLDKRSKTQKSFLYVTLIIIGVILVVCGIILSMSEDNKPVSGTMMIFGTLVCIFAHNVEPPK